jgi:5-methyltetrahydrofolate--homocysteine methyltransferase
MRHPILDLARRRAVVLDGAMGTEIQVRGLGPADFGGLDGLNEILVQTRPDVIEDIHRAYLDAGADVIETDSFGANAIVLAEYGLADRARALNRDAALLARRAADAFSRPGAPRFVAGSVGPGTRLPSLGQIAPDAMLSAYREQVAGLLEGGVDLLQVETCQDPMQARIALMAARDAMAAAGREVPAICTVTIDRRGTMLLGTDPAAAVASIATLPGVHAFGLNCAEGPEGMHAVLAGLSRLSPLPLAVLPNAGLPRNDAGRMVYDLSPDAFAAQMRAFVADFGVAFAGGCCGTTPAHIRAMAGALAGLPPAPPRPDRVPAASSLFVAVPFAQEPRPLIVGERTNANGSKAFRDTVLAGDLDGMVAVARDQAAEGAHLLDVSMALVGRDEAADVAAFVPRLREVAEPPLMIDSTEVDAIEAALVAWPGRAVVNSVHFEDGGARLDRVAALCRRHGAALVALTIDEAGMAMTVDRKLAIAHRLVDRLVGHHGFAPSDLFLDVLTFTLGSGDPSLRDAGARTIEAIRRVKAELPGVFTSLGVSNVSFGLKPPARRVLNSVFLNLCLEAGLDAAILNAGRVQPLSEIPDGLKALARDLVLPPEAPSRDPLHAFLEAFEAGGAGAAGDGAPEVATLDAAERIRRHVIRGDRVGLEAALDEELRNRPPLAIVQECLLDAMRTVGDRFGRGEMQLPFVLRSAEVMKAAVAYLEPRMDRVAARDKGTLVLATVAGDVHDIGKNLVDILLSNNGYRVVNLGIKQPIEAILEAAARERADAIGLSGLLVRSTVVMRDDLVEMRRRGLATPVLLGGAALNRRYVDEDLAAAYGGPVVYCGDAFDGLAAMDAVMAGTVAPAAPRPPRAVPAAKPGAREIVPPVDRVPVPAAFGIHVEPALPLAEVVRFVNRTALFRGQWQIKRGGMTDDEWRRKVASELEPMLQERLARHAVDGVLAPAGIWGVLPANADGDTVVVFAPDGRTEAARFAFPRQAVPPHLCLADWLLPLSDGRRDVLGIQVATAGPGVSRREAELHAAGAFTEYLYLHGIGVELAEAGAEWLHRRVRQALGIDGDDAADPAALLKNGYRGCRYSFGYAACPDLADSPRLLALLGADRIGVSLTETFQMVPEQSTSALVFHHPNARYFSV